jgi:hypothetical protein
MSAATAFVFLIKSDDPTLLTSSRKLRWAPGEDLKVSSLHREVASLCRLQARSFVLTYFDREFDEQVDLLRDDCIIDLQSKQVLLLRRATAGYAQPAGGGAGAVSVAGAMEPADGSTASATQAIGDSVLEINVGGTVFHALRSTLTSVGDSMLATLFAADSAFACQPTDALGRPFLDHDPDTFGPILGYLRRGGRLEGGCELGAALLPRLREDAQYFGLQGLVEAADAALEEAAARDAATGAGAKMKYRLRYMGHNDLTADTGARYRTRPAAVGLALEDGERAIHLTERDGACYVLTQQPG